VTLWRDGRASGVVAPKTTRHNRLGTITINGFTLNFEGLQNEPRGAKPQTAGIRPATIQMAPANAARRPAI
jgi:hypothetical protein